MPEWILGFDVGGTKTAVVAATPAGEILEERAAASDVAGGFESMGRSMLAMAAEMTAARGRPRVAGVSIGGPLDRERGIVNSPPNLPGWDRVPLRDFLSEHLGVPTHVEHDAKAGALAEWLFGAGRGCRNLVFLTFGTGLGAGLILDGRLYAGTMGSAGEVGHWRLAEQGPEAYGKVGSWEALSSGAGLPRLARSLFPDREWPAAMSAETVVGMARAGDAPAVAAVRASSVWLGRGISLLVDLLNPEVVVLGSLAVRAGDLFLPEARRVVERECLAETRDCRIVAAGLGERIGSLAAICAALYHEGLA
ncbi:MAG TPA: ROK family protein [Candidatus Dormibacteraeota bacterium]|jgi:glucokinase|nr:ROK family protein [Candidatus Dormibacteraeota bacterium]